MREKTLKGFKCGQAFGLGVVYFENSMAPRLSVPPAYFMACI